MNFCRMPTCNVCHREVQACTFYLESHDLEKSHFAKFFPFFFSVCSVHGDVLSGPPATAAAAGWAEGQGPAGTALVAVVAVFSHLQRAVSPSPIALAPGPRCARSKAKQRRIDASAPKSSIPFAVQVTSGHVP